MFCHLENDAKKKILREVRRVLKPGGRFHLLDFEIEKAASAHSPMRLFHSHKRLEDNSKSRILGVMMQCGLAGVKRRGQQGDPWTRSGVDIAKEWRRTRNHVKSTLMKKKQLNVIKKSQRDCGRGSAVSEIVLRYKPYPRSSGACWKSSATLRMWSFRPWWSKSPRDTAFGKWQTVCLLSRRLTRSHGHEI
jgi:hypothetical protein